MFSYSILFLFILYFTYIYFLVKHLVYETLISSFLSDNCRLYMTICSFTLYIGKIRSLYFVVYFFNIGKSISILGNRKCRIILRCRRLGLQIFWCINEHKSIIFYHWVPLKFDVYCLISSRHFKSVCSFNCKQVIKKYMLTEWIYSSPFNIFCGSLQNSCSKCSIGKSANCNSSGGLSFLHKGIQNKKSDKLLYKIY